MELGGTQRRPLESGVSHDPLGGELAPKVAEHRTVDATDHGDPVYADDRDVHQMLGSSPRGGPNQVPGRLVIAFDAASAVQDGPGPVYRGLDPIAREQVTGYV